MNPAPQKEIVHLPKFTVVGIERRVHFAQEKDQDKNQYRKAFQEFFGNKIHDQIANRAHPTRTYALYYDFKDGDDLQKFNYNILVGEEVTEVGQLAEGLTAYEVQESSYAKFTAGPGPIPDIVKQTWSSLHHLTPEQWGGKRTFKTEFELYKEGQTDLQNMVVELFIGITKE